MLSVPAGHMVKNSSVRRKRALAYQELEIEPYATIDANVAPKLEEVRVEMADMRVESKPVELLTSVGSCVAICLYDSVHKCGGLAHIMLPTSSAGPQEPLPLKYANTAVPALVKEIRKRTMYVCRLSAKIAGGANMFANFNVNSMDIGGKNVKAVKLALAEHRVRLLAEDVGGMHGRRITFNVVTGQATVRHHNGEIKKL